jgi:hypothetical protein
MYYNSDTDRGINIDEIARQCREAILRGKHQPTRYAEKINAKLQTSK